METYIVKKKNDKLFLFKEEQEIGQISPEAKWVKEGDEFDEEQLSIYWERTFLPLNTTFDVGKGEIKFDKIIAVKGPCGHFH